MSDDYTPTTEDIVRHFVAPPYKVEPQGDGESFSSYLSRISIETMHSQMASERGARRWLAEHDREIREAALEEAAQIVYDLNLDYLKQQIDSGSRRGFSVEAVAAIRGAVTETKETP